MNNKKYNVTLIQATDPVSNSTVTVLAKLFKISTDKAKKILHKKTFVIKKDTDKATAEKFHKAISAIGVNCEINEVEEESALPEIEDVKSSTQGRPLIDITRPDVTSPLLNEQTDLTLADGPVEKTANKKKKPIDNVDPANFCPECGTIRASPDSQCVHCDYDPIEIKRSNTKSILIKMLIALIILGIAAIFAFPYYQQYTKKSQIHNDLKLAFDTRNQVTEFILQTNFWPNQNIDAGLEKNISNSSLKSVTVGNNAVITVVLRAEALSGHEQTLILIPNTLKGRIVWNCLGGSLQKAFRPDICQSPAP